MIRQYTLVNPTKQVVIRWLLPIRPVYDHIYEHISQPLLLPDGIVALDRADLVKVDLDGHLIWRCPHNYGFWGSPIYLKPAGIVCASLDNAVHLIDEAGKIAKTIHLPTSVSTEILLGASSDLWFGMGAGQCAVTRINFSSGIAYEKYVTRDSGLRHPLALTVDGILWVASDDGLIRLHAESGEILTWIDGNDRGFVCISGALPSSDGALVAAVLPDRSHAILRVTNDGKVLDQYPLPPLWRAKLLAIPQGGAWLVGSTVSPWDPIEVSDQIFVARLASDGKPEAVTQAQPGRSIEANVDSDGSLWVGTYTYEDSDDSESGELIVYEGAAVACAKWSPDPPVGVGTPVLRSDGNGVVTTSTALVGFAVNCV